MVGDFGSVGELPGLVLLVLHQGVQEMGAARDTLPASTVPFQVTQGEIGNGSS